MRKFTSIWLLAALMVPAGFCQEATFEFHSRFWVNLHHFLYEQATGTETPADGSQWRAAVDYYKREVTGHDLLSREMEEVNNTLAKLEGPSSIRQSGLSAGLAAALDGAAPIYRERWWPEHNRANLAWIAAAKPLVRRYAGVLTKELASAYGTPWPAGPIRVDVAEYASWSGAYTTLDPTHITISSADPGNSGTAALEILFHEASHALVRNVRDALSREAKAQGKLFPRRDFWHALLFYTTGEIVRRHLEGYTPYAIRHGLYARAWPGALEALDRDWKPYLDGSIDMQTAVRRLVADYGTAPVR